MGNAVAVGIEHRAIAHTDGVRQMRGADRIDDFVIDQSVADRIERDAESVAGAERDGAAGCAHDGVVFNGDGGRLHHHITVRVRMHHAAMRAERDGSERVAGLVEIDDAGAVIAVGAVEARAGCIIDAGGADDEAADVGGESVAEREAVIIDEHDIAVGIERAAERSGVRRVDAVERNRAGAWLVELHRLAGGGIEAVPVEHGAVGLLIDGGGLRRIILADGGAARRGVVEHRRCVRIAHRK